MQNTLYGIVLAPVSDSKHEDNKRMAMGFLNEAEL